MLTIATNWTTISSLATGVGTLVLAIATFASVRSANRSARIAEEALLEQRRPILAQSRLDDPVQKIMFVEQKWVAARGGHGVAEHDGNLYFAMSLRNVGSGIGVCQAWHVATGLQSGRLQRDHTPEDQFRLQTRDLYIPAGDIGMWQGALRDRNDPTYRAVAEAIDNEEVISIELLYSDQVGEQRTISRFGLVPYERQDEEGRVIVEWFSVINRHWYLDRAGPRSEDQVAAAADVVLREREAADRLVEAEAQAQAEAEAQAQAEAEAQAQAEGSVEGAEAHDEGTIDLEVPRSAERNQSDRVRPDDAERGQTDGSEQVAVVPRPNCE